MMKFLLIDTSTERGVLALLHQTSDGVELLACKHLPVGLQNSSSLMPAIADLFAESALTPQELSFVAAGVGPGSYTGIRVGVAVAKTIAYSCNIPLVGVSTLLGFVPEADGRFAALIDAKVGGIYLLVAVRDGARLEIIEEPQICLLENLAEHLQGVSCVTVPLSHPVKARVEKILPDTSFSWQEMAPDAVWMGRIAYQKFLDGKGCLDGRLPIAYLRQTQAEIEKALR